MYRKINKEIKLKSEIKKKKKKTVVKLPFCVNACVIFLPKEPHSVESFPWLGRKIFQLSSQLYSAKIKNKLMCMIFSLSLHLANLSTALQPKLIK